MKVHHFVLPHPKTHKKAHLISHKATFVYIFLFIALQFGFKGIGQIQPQVLGISTSVSQQELIALTNEQRQKNGLPALKENNELDQAALEKGKNMIAENYWAHFSPSGKSPWDFISASGYKYSYAGENLARNFYSSQDVVNAWMASTMGHKENILNKHYTEIGMAVLDGNLLGQKTLLVVQEFGNPAENVIAKAPETNVPKQAVANNPVVNIPVNAIPQNEVQSVSTQSAPSISFDPYAFMKTVGFSVLGLIAFLILLDIYVIRSRKKATVNLYTRHAPNFVLMPIAATMLTHLGPGSIL